MGQEKIVVRQPIKFRSILFFLAFSTITPFLLFQVYFKIIEYTSISKVEKYLKSGQLPTAKNEIQNYISQFGINKDALILQLQIWDQLQEKDKSYDLKMDQVMVAHILLENFSFVPNEVNYWLGKFYYQMGSDYYPESMTYLEHYNEEFKDIEDLNLLNQSVGSEEASDGKIPLNLTLLDSSQKMLYEIYHELKIHHKELAMIKTLYHRYKKGSKEINTYWTIKLANTYLRLQERNTALYHLENILIILDNDEMLVDIGLQLVETAYQLNLMKKVDFYYSYLLEKKVITKKFKDQHRSTLKSMTKKSYQRAIL